MTREELLTMFGVQNGTRLSKWPFELQPETVQQIIETDAALRADLAACREEWDVQFLKIRNMESDCMEHCQDFTRAQLQLNDANKQLATIKEQLAERENELAMIRKGGATE